MKNLFSFSALFIAFLLSGCVPVKFYSDNGLNSGLKYYTVKPYLLVEKDLSTDRTVKASTIYLPDLENPQYIRIEDGFGSRKVDLKLSDGSINTFGTSTENDIAKSIEAFSTLIAKSASAVEDLKLKGIPQGITATYVELYEVSMIDGLTSLRKIEFR
jgi:hypothetical protein